ncbi:MAG TPA: MauE/DoxX family redox-associated membrane protein [Allosphingosinicella sp.]|nr:MauE/DoxX family redox-associated membrane protein [Allosphingosinicella sp.]
MTQAAPYIAELCRLGVGVLLAAAVIGKAASMRDFEETIGALMPLSRRQLAPTAWAITAAEGLIAAALAAGGAWARLGMAAALALFLLFAAVLLTALAQGKAVRCNCFGATAHPIARRDVLRNAALAAACAFYVLADAPALLDGASYSGLLGAGTALFLLCARLVARLTPAPPFTVPIGAPVPSFAGQWRSDDTPLSSSDLAGQPVVLVFLSSGCAACRAKVAELAEILPAARAAGVMLCIVGDEAGQGVAALLAGTPLVDQLLVLDAATRQRLNPRNTAPFYIFIDHLSVVQASNAVGDEDWQSFVEQMRDPGGLSEVADARAENGAGEAPQPDHWSSSEAKAV